MHYIRFILNLDDSDLTMEWIFLFLSSLSLKYFRNYSKLDLNFDKTINLFFGDNAAGKTNLLESIYYLATGNSHRTNNNKDLISWDKEFFYIGSEYIKGSAEISLEASYNISNKKKLKLNGVEKKEVNLENNRLNVVMFCPEDLMLVKGSPENRRRFLNLEIKQADKKYFYHLANYNKVLRQRNKFLKELNPSVSYDYLKEQLSIWDKQLAQHGVYLVKKRMEIVHKLGILSKLNSRKISEGKEVLEITYSPTLTLEKESLEECWHEYYNKLSCKEQVMVDLNRKFTTIGPHRDDIMFFINEKDARQFGSQGQIRTIVLALKMAELELMRSEIGEYPVFLLDDVLSELDENRRKHLINISRGKVQTFITGTSRDDFFNEILDVSRIYNVKDGKVVKIK